MSPPIDLRQATPLLGGLTPAGFMRRHWQKQPLLVRQAIPGVESTLSRAALFALAGEEGVESRLIQRREGRWSMRSGPFGRRSLPPLARPDWTLLVQGLNLQLPASHALMARFRFIPDARLDDVMVSFATDGGGVGPHVDSYDVFLLQLQGRRRWRIGPATDTSLVPGLPVKVLRHFVPEQEWLLEAGDLLYLPPGWGHDGVAEGECMTCSIGFRAASVAEFGREVLQRTLDASHHESPGPLYRDPAQAATAEPARIPVAMQRFAHRAVARLLTDSEGLDCSLGEWLSEPKAQVWFESGAAVPAGAGLRLDDRTRMLYDAQRVYINGESFRATGRDALLLRSLADARQLAAPQLARLSAAARRLLQEWAEAGWLRAI